MKYTHQYHNITESSWHISHISTTTLPNPPGTLSHQHHNITESSWRISHISTTTLPNPAGTSLTSAPQHNRTQLAHLSHQHHHNITESSWHISHISTITLPNPAGASLTSVPQHYRIQLIVKHRDFLCQINTGYSVPSL